MDLTGVGAEKLQRMVQILVAAAEPEKIILFGSRARGDARPDSDVDLLVVEAEPFDGNRSCAKESLRLRRALGAQGVDKDILVYSLEDVEYWRDSLNSVLARALREGAVLYERPKQAAALLQAAERDFEAARRMLDQEAHDVIFDQHVRQAADTLFKAWICLLDQPYPHRRDLEELMGILEAQDVPMEDFAALDQYTQHACRTRDRGESVPPLERPEAIRLVKRLRARVHDFWKERMGTPAPLTAGDRPV